MSALNLHLDQCSTLATLDDYGVDNIRRYAHINLQGQSISRVKKLENILVKNQLNSEHGTDS